MKPIRDAKCFLRYVVFTTLLCTLFATELSGQCDSNAIFCCENHASVVHKDKPEENENIDASSSYGDRWNAYSIKDEKWPKTNLTYTITRYSTQFSQQVQDDVIRKASQKWADVSALRIQAVPNTQTADIEVQFVPSLTNHVSSATYPGADKNIIKFRDNVRWKINKRGCERNLLLVATHEWGHALGVCHSNVPTAIMYGTNLLPRPADFSLDDDDVLAIQRLYGRNPDSEDEPIHDPGPSSDTPANEPFWDEDLQCFFMYSRRNSRWVLLQYDDDKWVRRSRNAPRPRNIPEPPPEEGSSWDSFSTCLDCICIGCPPSVWE